jgi:hypothetical protein
MKPGGTLILSFPNVRAITRLMTLAIKGKFPRTSGDGEHYDGGHLHYFTTRDIQDLLKLHGFDIVRSEGMLPQDGKNKKLVNITSKILGRKISREFILHGVVIKAVKK